MEYPLKNVAGEQVGIVELPDAVFAVPMNPAVVHQVMVAQQANARKGTASTKTRGLVSGGGRKPRPQKGSGRSRQGSIRSPQWRGGGIAFGPHPRSYKQRTPKKMRRLAIRCLLSEKAATGHLIVVDELDMEQPSTRGLKAMLLAMGADDSALIALDPMTRSVQRSSRNLEAVRATPAGLLNVVDLMDHTHLVMSRGAVQRVGSLWAQERPRRTVAAMVLG